MVKRAEEVMGEYQCGFPPGRSTIDHIFCMRTMLEKCYEWNVEQHHLFIDYKQAYDSIDRNILCEKLKMLVCPTKLIRLIRMTLQDNKGVLKIQGGLSKKFHIQKGVKQRDHLSPVLFNMVLETIMRSIHNRTGGCIYNRMTQHLAFADDVMITGRMVNALLGAFEESVVAAREVGLI